MYLEELAPYFVPHVWSGSSQLLHTRQWSRPDERTCNSAHNSILKLSGHFESRSEKCVTIFMNFYPDIGHICLDFVW